MQKSLYFFCIICSLLFSPLSAQKSTTLFGEEASTWAGEMILLSLKMNNSIAISAFQCDITLPVGFSVSSPENENITLSTERVSPDQIFVFGTAKPLAQTYRIAAVCNHGISFSGNQGIFAQINAKAEQSLETGSYNVSLSRIILSDDKGNAIHLTDTNFAINIAKLLVGDTNNDTNITISDITTIINYLNNPETQVIHLNAADIDRDGAVTDVDISLLINMLLGITDQYDTNYE